MTTLKHMLKESQSASPSPNVTSGRLHAESQGPWFHREGYYEIHGLMKSRTELMRYGSGGVEALILLRTKR